MPKNWFQTKWAFAGMHVLGWLIIFSLPFIFQPRADQIRPVFIWEKRIISPDSISMAMPMPFPPPSSEPKFINFPKRNIDIFIIAVSVIHFYANAFLFIPLFAYRKKIFSYILLELLSFAVFLLALYLTFKWSVEREEMTDFPMRLPLNIFTFSFLFILATSTTYRILVDKIKERQLVKERETENLKTELSFLRSQVSPHFMFNVLNNMVAMARIKSDQLEPSLIKLSGLMRYMLYETDTEKVPLQKEVEYLQSYIDLQKQRFGESTEIVVNIETVPGSYFIEPMLLIPFVENAFKHGTGLISDAYIHIDLKLIQDTLYFSVRNRYSASNKGKQDNTSGIGLANVKRRLNLLYGIHHSLLLSNEDDRFVVSLQIKLQ